MGRGWFWVASCSDTASEEWPSAGSGHGPAHVAADLTRIFGHNSVNLIAAAGTVPCPHAWDIVKPASILALQSSAGLVLVKSTL